MDGLSISWLAVIPGAVFGMALGALWYSPVLFAKPWMKAAGLTPEDVKPTPLPYAIAMTGWVIGAIVYSMIANALGITGVGGALLLSVLLWLGFSLPPYAMGVFYSNRGPMLLPIDSGYHLCGALGFGVAHALLG